MLGGFYTATAGEPVAALRSLLAAMDSLWPGVRSALAAAVTTGSGRKMIRELFRAELEVDEITAHARAAVELTRRWTRSSRSAARIPSSRASRTGRCTSPP